MPLGYAPKSKSKLNILVADDDFFMQRMLVIHLESMGHNCTTVDDGKATLVALKRQKFDLLFLDVVMPEMDGLEALIAIRKNEVHTASHLPIIMVSGHSEPEDIRKLKALGADACIAKPVKKEQIQTEISRFFTN
nr:response regulator [uncultured Undibacterium sp.]